MGSNKYYFKRCIYICVAILYIYSSLSCTPMILPSDWPIPEFKIPPGSRIVAVYGRSLVDPFPGIDKEWHVQFKSNKSIDEMILYIESALKDLNYRRGSVSPSTHTYSWIAPDEQTEVTLIDWTWDYGHRCDYHISINHWIDKLKR